jgi:hypothetical protein
VQDIRNNSSSTFSKMVIQAIDTKLNCLKKIDHLIQAKMNKPGLNTNLSVVNLKFLSQINRTSTIYLKEGKF